jgi:hypothetical protein
MDNLDSNNKLFDSVSFYTDAQQKVQLYNLTTNVPFRLSPNKEWTNQVVRKREVCNKFATKQYISLSPSD